MFFPTSIRQEDQVESAFTRKELQCTFTVVPQGYVNSSTLCHNIICQVMDQADILQNIALVYCVDDIMLIRLVEQAVANILEALRQHVLKGWEVVLESS